MTIIILPLILTLTATLPVKTQPPIYCKLKPNLEFNDIELPCKTIVDLYFHSLTSVKSFPLPYPLCEQEDTSLKNKNFQLVNNDFDKSANFRFSFLQSEKCSLLCPKNEEKVTIERMINQGYHYNLMIDDLPVLWCLNQTNGDNPVCQDSFPLGWNAKDEKCLDDGNDYFVTNHYNMVVQYLQVESPDYRFEIAGHIVGAKVYPHGVKIAKKSAEDVPVVYLSVSFEATDELTWANRKSNPHTKPNVYWICNALSTFFVLFLLYIHTTIIKGNSHFTFFESDKVAWKYINCDVFRPPCHGMFLSVLIGSGCHVFCTALVSLVYAAFTHSSSFSIGVDVFALVIYVLLSGPTSYITAHVYKKFGGHLFVKTWFYFCVFIPGIFISVYSWLNLLYYFNGSSAAVPQRVIWILISIWLSLHVFLTGVGFYFGSKKEINIPKANKIPRTIPEMRVTPIGALFSRIFCSLVPFCTMVIILRPLLAGIWGHAVFYLYKELVFCVVAAIISVCCTSFIFVHYYLQNEDYRWWWRSFNCGACVGLPLMGFFVMFFFEGGVSTPSFFVVRLLQTILIGFGVCISAGFVSFVSCWYSMKKLYFQVEASL